MGRVSNTQQSRPVPAPQPIDLDSQNLDLFPIAHLVDPVAEPGSDSMKVDAECIDPNRLKMTIRAFADDKARLKVIRSVNQDQRFPIIDVAEHLSWIAWPAADPEPQYVDRHAIFDDFETPCLARY